MKNSFKNICDFRSILRIITYHTMSNTFFANSTVSKGISKFFFIIKDLIDLSKCSCDGDTVTFDLPTLDGKPIFSVEYSLVKYPISSVSFSISLGNKCADKYKPYFGESDIFTLTSQRKGHLRGEVITSKILIDSQGRCAINPTPCSRCKEYTLSKKGTFCSLCAHIQELDKKKKQFAETFSRNFPPLRV